MTTDEGVVGAACEWARSFYFDLPELQGDPHPRLAPLRAECPVAHSEVAGGFWLLSTYEDVHFALQHPEIFSSTLNAIPPIESPLGPAIPTQLDPPEHTAYRQLLSPAFSPPRMHALEPAIRASARRLLKPIAERGSCDFLAEFAVPFPCEIFCTLMGLPADGLEQFLAWKDEMLRGIQNPDPAVVAANARGIRMEVARYFEAMWRERNRLPDAGDDLVGYLVGAQIDGRPLTENEFVRIAMLTFNAGLDTVTSQLALSVAYLAAYSDQRDRLVADPALVPDAVEELIRYETLIEEARVVVRDIEVRGTTLRVGDRVLLLLDSAGRDEEQFARADDVNFSRAPNRHLGFGAGPHRCLGSHLARLEMRVALEEMHRMIPTYRLDDSRPVLRRHGYVKGVERLDLVID